MACHQANRVALPAKLAAPEIDESLDSPVLAGWDRKLRIGGKENSHLVERLINGLFEREGRRGRVSGNLGFVREGCLSGSARRLLHRA